MDQRVDRHGTAVKRRIRLPGAVLLLWIVPIAFLGLFYFYPLASILSASFARRSVGILALFQGALADESVQKVIWFTFWQAALSTLLTLAVGLPGAYLLARFDFRGKRLLQALAGIPFVLPTLVVAAAFSALLGPRGWVNLGLMSVFNLSKPPLRFMNSLAAILVVHVFYNLTIVLRTVGDFWSHLDPRLSQAAKVLGASRWQSFRHVTFPLLAPAITTAALLVFLFDFTSFGVILILGGPRFATLEVEIYYQTISLFNLPLAAVLAITQLIFTLLMTFGYSWLSARLARPLALRPQKFTQRRLKTWRERMLAGGLILFLLMFTLAPLVSLALRSVTRLDLERGQRGPVERTFTMDYYRLLTTNPRAALFYVSPVTAIAVSMTYASITVLFSLFLGLPTAWALARQDKQRSPPSAWIGRLMDPILMLPLGTSAVTLGLGFILAFSRGWLDWRASPLLIPLAHTLVAFPFVVRSLAPALRSIKPRLRQAAAVLGAEPWQVFRAVDLPLVGRALLVAATFAFTISLGEFGATVLVARPEYPTVPMVIYRLLGRPGALNYGQAMALSTLLMLVSAAGMLAIERLRVADIGEF
jgi:thiamine transport system permease protein